MPRISSLLRLAMWLVALVPPAAAADDPPPFPDFTFKMGKPPEPGETPRITVQITPDDPAAETGASAPDARTDAPALSWFWAAVPTGQEAVAGNRMAAAWDRLRQEPAGRHVPAPPLQQVQAIARAHGAEILRATVGTRVSPALALAVIAVESSGDPTAQSDKGARGLMQLMPDTAARFGVEDALAPGQNIHGGVAYLDWLMGEFGNDAVLALAGYNAGENAVREHAGVPPFAETRGYVPRVLAAFDVARALCKTRPDLITDACALELAMK